jgi:putative membrane protein
MKNILVTLIKGTLIGVANMIPGVSGGTMAVILGLYDRLIESISQLIGSPSKWRQYAGFLITLGMGAVIGVVLFARLIDWALMKHEQLSLLFFMGLILGSIPSVVAHSRLKGLGIKEILIIGISLILVLTLGMFRSTEPFLGPYIQDFTPLILFLVSIAAGGAMIVPGVSGSFVFLLFNQYTVLVEAVNDIVLGSIAIIVLGGILGVFVFAKIIHHALTRWFSITHCAIIGLVGGSIIVLFKGFPPTIQGTLLGVAFFLLGTVLSAISYRYRS